jgi:hypothetical protein
MDESYSGSCPKEGFGIRGAEASGYATIILVN